MSNQKEGQVIIDAIKMEEFIQEKLYKFNAAKELAWAWNVGENLILFGPGGYGKSDAALTFAQYLRKEGHVSTDPFILAFGQGMTEERLLGGLDVKKFQDNGEIEYLLANAFVSNEIVIFEELWDAFPAVLLILKDILQSKMVRMGTKMVPIKTKMVIACTNRSRDEVVSDDSTEALMQRFLFEKEVRWTNHHHTDYLKALKCATGVSRVTPQMVSVAHCCHQASKNDHKISPRTAYKAYRSAEVNGLISLKGMYGFENAVDEAIRMEAERKKDTEQLDILQDFKESVDTWFKNSTEEKSGLRVIEDIVRIMLAEKDLRKLSLRDGSIKTHKEVQNHSNDCIVVMRDRAVALLTKPKPGTFADNCLTALKAGHMKWLAENVKLTEESEVK